MKIRQILIAAFCLISLPGTAIAQWSLIPANKSVSIANSTMKVTPKSEWNRWSSRPSSNGEIWTQDGLSLNELTFFAKLSAGDTLYNQTDSFNNPLPKFRKDMLPTDLVELFEASNRILLQSSVFKVDGAEPAKLGGYSAVRFQYSYASEADGLIRKGEGVAANIDGKFYMVNFVAPQIHYFDRDLPEFREIVASISI
jgi:hypothetical protein